MEHIELAFFLALSPLGIKEAERVSAGLGLPILCGGREGSALAGFLLDIAGVDFGAGMELALWSCLLSNSCVVCFLRGCYRTFWVSNNETWLVAFGSPPKLRL